MPEQGVLDSLALPSAPSATTSLASPPGRAIAIFLNRLLTLCPALADVSIESTLSSLAFLSSSSGVTCLETRRGKATSNQAGQSRAILSPSPA